MSQAASPTQALAARPPSLRQRGPARPDPRWQPQPQLLLPHTSRLTVFSLALACLTFSSDWAAMHVWPRYSCCFGPTFPTHPINPVSLTGNQDAQSDVLPTAISYLPSPIYHMLSAPDQALNCPPLLPVLPSLCWACRQTLARWRSARHLSSPSRWSQHSCCMFTLFAVRDVN
jgi:hypothetical protein